MFQCSKGNQTLQTDINAIIQGVIIVKLIGKL